MTVYLLIIIAGSTGTAIGLLLGLQINRARLARTKERLDYAILEAVRKKQGAILLDLRRKQAS